jgi:dTDP-4-amino-4,6-dideoxygalactose transaminase
MILKKIIDRGIGMIPIRLSESKKEQLKKWYTNFIEEKAIGKKADKYYNEVEKELISYGLNYKMKNILVMEFEELDTLRRELESRKILYKQYNVPKAGKVNGFKYIVENKILKKTYGLYDKMPKAEFVKK